MENQIRVLRREKGISQEDLAKRCGVSRQTINAIENNKYDPTLSLAFRLARELGVPVDGLFSPGEPARWSARRLKNHGCKNSPTALRWGYLLSEGERPQFQ